MFRYITRIAVLFLAATLLLSSGIAYAIELGGLGGRPLNENVDEEFAKDWFIYTLEPGSEIEDTLVVQNFTSETEIVTVYPTDSTPSTDGAFALKQFAEPMIQVGSWIQLEPLELTLAPGQIEEVPFKLVVPENVEIGEYKGGIAIERKRGTKDIVDPQTGLKLNLRVAVRVYVTVPGEIIRNLELVDFFTQEKPNFNGQYRSVVKLRNGGNVSQFADVTLRVEEVLFNSFSKEYASKGVPVSRADDALGITDERTLNFDWQIPTFGRVMTFATINYKDNDGNKVIFTDVQYHWVLPWNHIRLAGIVLAGLLALFVLIYVVRRIYVLTAWQRYKIQAGDTLLGLAIGFDMSWKRLVSANRLRKPYDVQLYDYIRVPKSKLALYNLKQKIKKPDAIVMPKKSVPKTAKKLTKKSKKK